MHFDEKQSLQLLVCSSAFPSGFFSIFHLFSQTGYYLTSPPHFLFPPGRVRAWLLRTQQQRQPTTEADEVESMSESKSTEQ